MKDNFINRTFDKVYCLNLKHRADRWESAMIGFDRFNIDVLRFGAIDGKKLPQPPNPNSSRNIYEMATTLSHMSILKHALDHKFEQVLIFEDDVVLHDDFVTLFENYYLQLPPDWNVCYTGGNFLPEKIDPIKMISSNLHICSNIYTLTGYFIKCKYIEHILNAIETDNFMSPVDDVYVDLQQSSNMYMFYPRLIYQRPSYSDIVQGFRDYECMRDF